MRLIHLKLKNKNSMHFLAVISFVFVMNANAKDLVILKSGEILEGTIFSQSFGKHLDISLDNGTKRRIKANQIEEVKTAPVSTPAVELKTSQEIPSAFLSPNPTHPVQSSTPQPSLFHITAIGGTSTPLDEHSTGSFSFGLKAQVDLYRLPDGTWLAAGLGYQNAKTTYSGFGGSTRYNSDVSRNHVSAILSARRIMNTGFFGSFFLGGSFGTWEFTKKPSWFLSSDINVNHVLIGVGLGYEIRLNHHFSIGPELNYRYLPATMSELEYDNGDGTSDKLDGFFDSSNEFSALINLIFYP